MGGAHTYPVRVVRDFKFSERVCHGAELLQTTAPRTFSSAARCSILCANESITNSCQGHKWAEPFLQLGLGRPEFLCRRYRLCGSGLKSLGTFRRLNNLCVQHTTFQGELKPSRHRFAFCTNSVCTYGGFMSIDGSPLAFFLPILERRAMLATLRR